MSTSRRDFLASATGVVALVAGAAHGQSGVEGKLVTVSAAEAGNLVQDIREAFPNFAGTREDLNRKEFFDKGRKYVEYSDNSGSTSPSATLNFALNSRNNNPGERLYPDLSSQNLKVDLMPIDEDKANGFAYRYTNTHILDHAKLAYAELPAINYVLSAPVGAGNISDSSYIGSNLTGAVVARNMGGIDLTGANLSQLKFHPRINDPRGGTERDVFFFGANAEKAVILAPESPADANANWVLQATSLEGAAVMGISGLNPMEVINRGAMATPDMLIRKLDVVANLVEKGLITPTEAQEESKTARWAAQDVADNSDIQNAIREQLGQDALTDETLKNLNQAMARLDSLVQPHLDIRMLGNVVSLADQYTPEAAPSTANAPGAAR